VISTEHESLVLSKEAVKLGKTHWHSLKIKIQEHYFLLLLLAKPEFFESWYQNAVVEYIFLFA